MMHLFFKIIVEKKWTFATGNKTIIIRGFTRNANTGDENLDAKNVVALHSANTENSNLNVKNVVALKYANTADKNLHAKNVVVVQYANTAG